LKKFSRAEANKVLQEAVQVRSELEKAEDAQKNAEQAIETAREDITQADIYLKQVFPPYPKKHKIDSGMSCSQE